ncbi:hypothetical protein JCM21900_005561 [Sporobolomyces salmonicolor]
MAKSITKGKSKAAAPPPVPSPPSSSSASSSSSRSDDDSSSSSSGSDRDSSASPEPEAAPQQRRVDPSTQKYTPPAGLKAVKDSGKRSMLDWDELNDDQELELWAVRVPAGLKAKHLDKVTIQLPSGIPTPLQPVAAFSASKSDYNAFLSTGAAAKASNKRRRDDAEDVAGEGAQGGNEMQSLVPLVPRRSQGNKLYQAPRAISRTLLITRALPPTIASLASQPASHSSLIASQPSPVPGALLTAAELTDPAAIALKKTARVQPEGLKFRLNLPGMGAKGGEGKWSNGVVLENREAVVRASAVAQEGEGDVEMNEAADEEAEKKPKKSKKDKEGKSPKKKKAKTEE